MDTSPMETFDYHHSMLSDRTRVEAFLRAVVAAVQPGDVVVDIGSGTGLLSLIAARAGARRVYAIESGPVIEVGREVAARNGFGDRVVFLDGASSEIELPELADVVISETIGNAALDEGIAAWLDDARRRFLKPGGAIVPESVRAMVSLVHLPRTYAEADRWREPLLGMDFTPLASLALQNLQWAELSPASLVTEPEAIVSLVFGGRDPGQLGAGAFVGEVRTHAAKDSLVHGIGVWFHATLVDGIQLSNEPPNPAPSWLQGLLPLERPIAVGAGQPVLIRIRVSGDGCEWKWTVGLLPE